MAELKHTFIAGMMDKDRDERLVKNGTYRDALNIHISSSEGSDVGAVENLLGNKQLTDLGLKNAQTIGSITYGLKDKIYWIITSDNIDGIYEYDQVQKVIEPIIIDTKRNSEDIINGLSLQSNDENELVLSNITANQLKTICGNIPDDTIDEVLVNNNIHLSSQDPYLDIDIPQNTILRKENNKYVFKNIEYNGQEYGNISITFSFSIKSVLNFSKNNLITGIDIIDDMLFFTDNLNAPRKINISKFKKYTNTPYPNTNGVFLTQTLVQYSEKDSNGNIVNATREFNEDDLSVAKKAPMKAPTLDLYNSLITGVTEIEKIISFYITSNNGDKEIGIGDNLTIDNLTTLPNWNEGDDLELSSYTDDGTGEFLEATAIVKQKLASKIIITLTSRSYKPVKNINYRMSIALVEKKAIHELSFVRFGYRWKYFDGEYSTMSPFSETAFLPQEYQYNAKEGLNLGMENDLRKVILNDFDLGDDTVKEIEILYKETRNQNIYTLKSFKRIDFNNSYEITKERIHSVLPNDQLLRAWDNVPKKAKAQAVTANRIIYGNYTQNYDIYNTPEFGISYTKRNVNSNKKTIKSDRTYQIGVAYIDEYNRHSPVLSDQSGSINISKDKTQETKQFEIRLKNNPPAWAKYFKYYIKDNSGEYYNIAADRFYYDDQNGFMYVSFSSNERNKVNKDEFIILKKEHGTNLAVTDSDNRYKVIEIFNEPPNFVADKKKVISSLDDVLFTSGYNTNSSGGTLTQVKTENSTPVANYSKIQIKRTNAGVDPDDDDNVGVPGHLVNELKPGRFIRFDFNGKESQPYEIKSVSADREDSTEIEITIKDSFNDDVNIIYDRSGNVGDASTALYNPNNYRLGVRITILEKFSDYKNEEFDGRFFIKLKANNLLKTIFEGDTVDNKDYSILEKLTLFGTPIFSDKKKDKRTRPPRKIDENPKYPLFLSHNGTASNYTFKVEELNTKVDDKYLDLFVNGAKFYFSNDKDTIYEIEKSIKGNTVIEVGGRGNKFEKANAVGTREVSIFVADDPLRKAITASQLKAAIPKYGDQNNSVDILFVEEKTGKITFTEDPAIFETEPKESKTDLDIYYETERAFEIAEHGNLQKLEWYNAFCFGNGVESNRIRDDFNAPFIDNGVKVSATIAEEIREEHKFNGVIWSGIVNSKSGVNKSNEFNIAFPITKDLLPSYGSIQKLHAWDDQIVMLCEDKIVRALADKDILYNADGSPNVVATNKVIGAVSPYAGEYGISKNPESFASYGFRCYFADKTRGVVIRLSKDGLEVISRYFMTNFFKERFFDDGCYHANPINTNIIGSYDNYNNLYNISFDGLDTVCFDETVNGWVTRKSFIPENGLSLNNIYYTYRNGELWEQDARDALYNNFYGVQYTSKIELEINDDPSVIKKYRTLSYEGTKGWTAKVITDQQNSSIMNFKEKENKYFSFIKGEEKTVENLDPKNFNFQGLGVSSDISAIGSGTSTELTFGILPIETNSYLSKITKISNVAGTALNNTAEIIISPKPGYVLNANSFSAKNITATQSGDNIVLDYTHGIAFQPTKNKHIDISLCKVNFANKKTITVTGAHAFEPNKYIDSDIPNGNFTITGPPNVLKTVVTRTVTAKSGFKVDINSIRSNNPNVDLTVKSNNTDDTSVTITEKITIPSNDNNNFNYIITVDEIQIQKAKKQLLFSQINTNDAVNDVLVRDLEITGNPGSEFSFKLQDTGSFEETEFNIVIDNTGKYNRQVVLPPNSPDTYTITITPTGDTINGPDFEDVIIIPYSAKQINKISLFSQFKNTTSNVNEFQAFTNDGISYSFTHEITLPAATYLLISQPQASDFAYDNKIDDPRLSNLFLSLDQGNNKITLTGNIEVDKISTSNQIVLFLDSFVNEQVTLDIEYANTTLAGAGTGNYSFIPSIPFQITGAALNIATTENFYQFVISPSVGHEFINNISSQDFIISDSLNDVTSTYAENGTLKVLIENNNLLIRLIPSDFNLPSSSQTIFIRPNKTITQAVTVPAGNYSISYTPLDNEDRLFTNKLILGKLTDTSNQNFLFQKTFTIDRTGPDFTKIFSATGHIVNLLDNELSLATAGTYTDINGDSITVTDHIEINTDKTELRLNILANINSVPDKVIGRIEFDFATEELFTVIKLKQGGCGTTQPTMEYRLYNIDPYDPTPKIGARITEINSNQIGATSGITSLENEYKIDNTDFVITLKKDFITSIDYIKDIQNCTTTVPTVITANNIISTYGDGTIKIGAVVNNNHSKLKYELISGTGVVGISDGILKSNTGQTPPTGVNKIKVYSEEVYVASTRTLYEYAEKTITITVKKANPTVSTLLVKLTEGDTDDLSLYITTNSGGVLDYFTSYNNIMTLNGSSITATGEGNGKVGVRIAETSNYNSARANINVEIAKFVVPIVDSDGDGIPDSQDTWPFVDDNVSWRFGSDLMGLSNFVKKSNGQLSTINQGGGRGYLAVYSRVVTPKYSNGFNYDKSQLTWRAYVDIDADDLLDYGRFVRLHKTTGVVSDDHDDKTAILTGGDPVEFSVAGWGSPNSSKRRAKIYVDIYYKGKLVQSGVNDGSLKQTANTNSSSTVSSSPKPTSVTATQAALTQPSSSAATPVYIDFTASSSKSSKALAEVVPLSNINIDYWHDGITPTPAVGNKIFTTSNGKSLAKSGYYRISGTKGMVLNSRGTVLQIFDITAQTISNTTPSGNVYSIDCSTIDFNVHVQEFTSKTWDIAATLQGNSSNDVEVIDSKIQSFFLKSAADKTIWTKTTFRVINSSATNFDDTFVCNKYATSTPALSNFTQQDSQRYEAEMSNIFENARFNSQSSNQTAPKQVGTSSSSASSKDTSKRPQITEVSSNFRFSFIKRQQNNPKVYTTTFNNNPDENFKTYKDTLIYRGPDVYTNYYTGNSRTNEKVYHGTSGYKQYPVDTNDIGFYYAITTERDGLFSGKYVRAGQSKLFKRTNGGSGALIIQGRSKDAFNLVQNGFVNIMVTENEYANFFIVDPFKKNGKPRSNTDFLPSLPTKSEDRVVVIKHLDAEVYHKYIPLTIKVQNGFIVDAFSQQQTKETHGTFKLYDPKFNSSIEP